METEYELWWSGKDIPFSEDTWVFTDFFETLEHAEEAVARYKTEDIINGICCWYKIVKVTWIQHREIVYEDALVH